VIWKCRKLQMPKVLTLTAKVTQNKKRKKMMKFWFSKSMSKLSLDMMTVARYVWKINFKSLTKNCFTALAISIFSNENCQTAINV
jgi:hypothetical protein